MRYAKWALLLALLGCSDAPATTPTAGTVYEPPGTRKVGALVMTLSLELDAATGPLADFDGRTLAPAQLAWVEIEVDGRPWGRYAPTEDETPGAVDVDGWQLTERAAPAVVVADLDYDLDSLRDRPDTVADWTRTLNRALAPGDHLARIRAIALRNEDGVEMSVDPDLLIPFTAAVGAGSALLGELTIPIAHLETHR
jgi:hypothetical protein